MELNITHLQHYLAYGLRVQHTSIDEDVTDICNVESISIDCVTFDNGCDYYFEDSEEDNPIIKPLLLPLSALYEEIDGEIAMKVIGEMLGYDLSKYVDNDGDIFYGFDLTDKSIPYKIPMEDREIYFIYFDTNLKWFYMVNQWFEPDDECECIPFNLEVSSYLDSKHYDWRYGLIDKGLAIDKRSVK